MIKKGSIITTPKDPRFYKNFKSKNNTKITSFLYNVTEKDNSTNKYDIKERYIINILNIEPNYNQRIIVEEIISVVPQINKDKNGKEYLNVSLLLNCAIPNKPSHTRNNNEEEQKPSDENNNNNYNDTINSLDDYADFI